MKITMLGGGYVGLVSAACFAEFGTHVVCVDKDTAKVESLSRGEIPIYENGLETLVARNLKRGTLRFTTDLKEAMAGSAAIFIAVGTPARRGDGHADLSYVYAAAKEIASHIQGFQVVVTKSTVPVGTGRTLQKLIAAQNPKADFAVASNPEFLREGSAIDDFMRPDRVVIGVEDDRAAALLKSLYRPLYLNETPIAFMNLETAELTKYAANAFLATKITFINEIADLCEKTGANVQDIARALGLDKRIGSKFLHAGPGFGGSCFPKDTLALLKTAHDLQSPVRIVEAVVEANNARKIRMAEKIIAGLGGNVQGMRLAILGVTFKPNTDDMRDAPSLTILPLLQKAGAVLQGFDPAGMGDAQKLLPAIEWMKNSAAALEGADACVILTEWNEFRALDLAHMAKTLTRKTLIDLRNIYKPNEARAAGLTYISVGR